jgi:hypothetical protein
MAPAKAAQTAPSFGFQYLAVSSMLTPPERTEQILSVQMDSIISQGTSLPPNYVSGGGVRTFLSDFMFCLFSGEQTGLTTEEGEVNLSSESCSQVRDGAYLEEETAVDDLPNLSAGELITL